MKRSSLLKKTKDFFVGDTGSYNLSKASYEKLVVDIYESIKQRLDDEPEIIAVNILNKERINSTVKDTSDFDKIIKIENESEAILLKYYAIALSRILKENDTSFIPVIKRLLEELIKNVNLISNIYKKDVNFLKELFNEFKNNLNNKDFDLISETIFSKEIDEIINALKNDSQAKEIRFKK